MNPLSIIILATISTTQENK
ncbi:TPA: hypothetical protein ACGFDW_001832 [Escherichia coli]